MSKDLSERVYELLDTYTSLRIAEETDECIKLAGNIDVHRSIGQFVLCNSYEIEIYIPRKDGELPYVVDTGKAINSKYPHLYSDRKLCLATDIDMQIAFSKDTSLVRWVKDFVETYFVSYEYYERYGIFPIGERAHGINGIIQSYMELFDVDEIQAARIIIFLANNAYRGHQPCPCGSGARIRNCHGNKLLYFYNNPFLLEQVKTDYEMIEQEVRQYEYAKQLRNKE